MDLDHWSEAFAAYDSALSPRISPKSFMHNDARIHSEKSFGRLRHDDAVMTVISPMLSGERRVVH